MISGKARCGLRYAVKRSGSAVGYCALSIHCGTRDEAGFPSGIAHFTEHTIFKGTEQKSASVINGYLDRLGGELNAYTTKEEIVIHSTVLKEDLPKAMSLLLEIATSSIFPEHEIEVEKGVVIDEINSYKDSPADDIYDRFEETLFEGHPLGGIILGTEDSVKSITSADLQRFAAKFFIPERMAFTIVADLDEAVLEKKVLTLAGKFWEGKVNEPADFRTTPVGIENHFERSEDKENHEVNAIIGGYAPTLYQEKERLTAVLLANILGGPASNSILNADLREKHGWVYGVECSYTQYTDSGIMAISLGCDKENLEKCLRHVRKAIQKLQQTPFTAARLKAAKKQLLGQLAISSDNGETQCLSMGKSLLAFGHIASDTENRNAIESISAEDLQHAACTIFAEQNLSTLIYV